MSDSMTNRLRLKDYEPLTEIYASLFRQRCNCKMGVSDYHINGEWDDNGWDCKIMSPKEISENEQVFIQQEPLRKVLIAFI